MFTKYERMGCMSGEESRSIISKVENTFYWYKITIGRNLRARTEHGREVEAKIVAKILNRFMELDTAESERIA